MYDVKDLPGTPQHKAMLQSIASYYENDPRILAVSIFGSLGRGNWDSYSDLDLDIVIADTAQIEVVAEVEQLCASLAPIGEQIALLIPDDDDAADVVFKSFMELSVRYHPLSTTSPNIVDSLQIITGRIDRAVIEAAGLANRKINNEPIHWELDRCIRYAVEADNALRRGYLWSAIELLHYMRGNVMELFTRSHQGKRAYQFFQKEADQKLQIQLGGALPQYDLRSIQKSLMKLLDILAHDLEQLTDGQVQLTREQSELLTRIIARQNELKL